MHAVYDIPLWDMAKIDFHVLVWWWWCPSRSQKTEAEKIIYFFGLFDNSKPVNNI